jgi:hypothetical protein
MEIPVRIDWFKSAVSPLSPLSSPLSVSRCLCLVVCVSLSVPIVKRLSQIVYLK